MHDFIFSGELSIAAVLFRFFISFLLSGIIGFERSRHGRPAGLRTHIIVCLGSTMTALIGQYTCLVMGFSSDPMRVSAQVISGIGFLGAGTIFMRKDNHVVGLTTAAGLWTTAAIGIIVGLGFYSFALVMTGIEILAMVLLGKWEIARQERRKARKLYLEINSIDHLQEIIDLAGKHRVEVLQARTMLPGHIGLRITLLQQRQADTTEQNLRSHAGVVCILQEND